MIRRTRQRMVIESVLRSSGRPLSPAEIYEQAHREQPRLGLRTVYRQIEDLKAEGRLCGVDYPGQPVRYELVGEGHHSHFLCRSCQKVFDLPGELPDYAVTPPPGFIVDGQETVFYGVCPACRSGGSPAVIKP